MKYRIGQLQHNLEHPSVSHGVQIFELEGTLRQGFRSVCTMEKGPGLAAYTRLFNAAPDLLSAAKIVLNGGIDTGHTWEQALDLLKAAIAKAEGRQP